MPDRRTLIFGAAAILGLVAIIAIIALVGRLGNRREDAPALTGTAQSFMFGGTVTPTTTGTVYPLPTATMTATQTADLTCEHNCVWSSQCVALGMVLPERNGMTRVIPNRCIPINTAYWNITPDNPFWGMPCSRDTIGVCVWSRNCVELGRVMPEKNGLTRVKVNSCDAIDPQYQDP